MRFSGARLTWALVATAVTLLGWFVVDASFFSAWDFFCQLIVPGWMPADRRIKVDLAPHRLGLRVLLIGILAALTVLVSTISIKKEPPPRREVIVAVAVLPWLALLFFSPTLRSLKNRQLAASLLPSCQNVLAELNGKWPDRDGVLPDFGKFLRSNYNDGDPKFPPVIYFNNGYSVRASLDNIEKSEEGVMRFFICNGGRPMSAIEYHADGAPKDYRPPGQHFVPVVVVPLHGNHWYLTEYVERTSRK